MVAHAPAQTPTQMTAQTHVQTDVQTDMQAHSLGTSRQSQMDMHAAAQTNHVQYDQEFKMKLENIYQSFKKNGMRRNVNGNSRTTPRTRLRSLGTDASTIVQDDSSDIVLSNGVYSQELYIDIDEINISNNYVFKGAYETEIWSGTKINTDKNLVYKYYEEYQYYCITLLTSIGQIKWAPHNYKFPLLVFLSVVEISINDNFMLSYGSTEYENIELSFTGNIIILNGQIINKSFAMRDEYAITLNRIENEQEITINIFINNFQVAMITTTDKENFQGMTTATSFAGINREAIGQWLKDTEYKHPSSGSVMSIASDVRYDLLGNLVMRSDMSSFYDVTEEPFENNTKIECSAVLVNGEYIKCDMFGIIGFGIYTYETRKYDYKIREIFVNEGDEVIIYPRFNATNYKRTDDNTYNTYVVYSDEGYYLSDETPSMIITYFTLIPGDLSYIVAIDIADSTVKLLGIKDNGYYDMFVFKQYGRLQNIYYELLQDDSFNIIDLTRLYVKKLIIAERNIRYIQWPVPLPINSTNNFMTLLQKVIEPEEFSLISLIEEADDITLKNDCLHRYARTFGKYPLLQTSDIMCNNKEYELTYDNNKYRGLVLKNGNYYSFCSQFTMNYNSKLVFKIYSSLFRMSMQFD